MVDIVIISAAIFIALALLMAFIRFIKGPGLVNRVVAFDVMGIIAISAIGLVAHWAERVIYLDTALIYAFLAFLGVVVVGRFIERGL